jgi:hypothetical protein
MEQPMPQTRTSRISNLAYSKDGLTLQVFGTLKRPMDTAHISLQGDEAIF